MQARKGRDCTWGLVKDSLERLDGTTGQQQQHHHTGNTVEPSRLALTLLACSALRRQTLAGRDEIPSDLLHLGICVSSRRQISCCCSVSTSC